MRQTTVIPCGVGHPGGLNGSGLDPRGLGYRGGKVTLTVPTRTGLNLQAGPGAGLGAGRAGPGWAGV